MSITNPAARKAMRKFCLDCRAGVPHLCRPGIYMDPRRPKEVINLKSKDTKKDTKKPKGGKY